MLDEATAAEQLSAIRAMIADTRRSATDHWTYLLIWGVLGVYPLVVASGAGAASRRALGTAVFGGMLTSTFLAVLFVPVFYVMAERASARWAARRRPDASREPPRPDGIPVTDRRECALLCKVLCEAQSRRRPCSTKPPRPNN